MVRPDVWRRKSERIAHHVERLRRHLPLDAETLEASEDLANITMMDLLQAIQACIDLAAHCCSHEGLGAPSSPGDAFVALGQVGRLPTALANRLRAASGLRNLIVHAYGDIHLQQVARVVNEDLADLLDCAARLAPR